MAAFLVSTNSVLTAVWVAFALSLLLVPGSNARTSSVTFSLAAEPYDQPVDSQGIVSPATDFGRSLLQSTDVEESTCSIDELIRLLEALRSRVVGGVPVNPRGKYPYVVNIVRFGVQPFCGGVLIAADVVMTAAHCDKSYSSIWIGRHDMSDASEEFESIAIAEKSYPPAPWNHLTNDNDIVLFRLAVPSKFPPVAIDGTGELGLKRAPLTEQVEASRVMATTMGWSDQFIAIHRQGTLNHRARRRKLIEKQAKMYARVSAES
eukprot:scaffold34012_cov46-Prasinocladus_malaysianus.AAC.3